MTADESANKNDQNYSKIKYNMKNKFYFYLKRKSQFQHKKTVHDIYAQIL